MFVYIIMRSDDGLTCLTDGRPGARSIKGETFLFTDNLISVTLPSRKMSAANSSVSNQKVSFSYFDRDLSPGSRLSNGYRMQNSRVEVYLLKADGDAAIMSFSGNATSFSYDMKDMSVKISASVVESLVNREFPPSKLLDDGRFVKRNILDTSKYFGIPAYAEGVQYLAPVFEFNTVFGTPSNPLPDIYFLNSPIQVTSDRVLNDLGTKIWFDDKASDLAVPVVYGNSNNVPLNILGHYRIVFRNPNDDFNYYYKVFIAITAGHVVQGDPLASPESHHLSPPVDPDFYVDFLWDSFNLSDTRDELGRAHFPYGYYGIDPLGGEFSYVTFAVQYFGQVGVPTEDSFEDANQPTGFDIYQAVMPRLNGRVGSGGRVLSGLGDVLEDLWLNYSLASDRADLSRIKSESDELNQYQVDVVFNNVERAQTLLKIIGGRLQKQFPFAFCYTEGLLHWKHTALPPKSEPSLSLIYGVNSYSRGSIEDTKYKDIVNNVSLSYGVNGNSPGRTQEIKVNDSNNSFALSSVQRWGRKIERQIDINDTQSISTARKIADNVIRMNGGIRISASYLTDDISIYNLPYLSVISVTDEEAGFEDEPFYFFGATWEPDLTGFTVSLLSVKMI